MNEQDVEKRNSEFLEAAKPLMKLLAENYHPHVTAIITANTAELLEGIVGTGTDEFLVD